MVDRGFLIRGRVQGVGFRWWTRSLAHRLGVLGTVKNLRDGSVEVMARADEEAMAEFADQLRHGPPAAMVEEIERVATSLRNDVSSFSIEH